MPHICSAIQHGPPKGNSWLHNRSRATANAAVPKGNHSSRISFFVFSSADFSSWCFWFRASWVLLRSCERNEKPDVASLGADKRGSNALETSASVPLLFQCAGPRLPRLCLLSSRLLLIIEPRPAGHAPTASEQRDLAFSQKSSEI